MIKEAIIKIVDKQDLTYDEAYTVINEIMSGETTPTQNAAFLRRCPRKAQRQKQLRKLQDVRQQCAAMP